MVCSASSGCLWSISAATFVVVVRDLPPPAPPQLNTSSDALLPMLSSQTECPQWTHDQAEYQMMPVDGQAPPGGRMIVDKVFVFLSTGFTRHVVQAEGCLNHPSASILSPPSPSPSSPSPPPSSLRRPVHSLCWCSAAAGLSRSSSPISSSRDYSITHNIPFLCRKKQHCRRASPAVRSTRSGISSTSRLSSVQRAHRISSPATSPAPLSPRKNASAAMVDRRASRVSCSESCRLVILAVLGPSWSLFSA